MPFFILKSLPGRVTVLAIHNDGSRDDLNAKGEPCVTMPDVLALIAELRAQGLEITAECDADVERAVGLANVLRYDNMGHERVTS
jgi:hypothetical protein